jgi:hypothetical protein
MPDVFRYTQPATNLSGTPVSDLHVGIPTPPPPPAPTPAAADSSTMPGLLTQDQFTANRTGSVDENAIREQTRKNMQAQIDATNNYYADLVSQENNAGNARLDKVRAINVNSGLGGSNFATSADLTQRDKNSGAVKAIQNEQNLKIQEVNGKIDEIATKEIAAKKAEAIGNADAYTKYLADAKTEANGQLAQLAGANVDLSTLDANRKAYLFKSAGLDNALGELVYNSMKPKAAQIDYKAEKAADGKILLYGVNPTTGELKQQRINFDVPPGYEPAYVDGQLYYKNAATGDLIPSPTDTSLYTPGYKDYLLSKQEGFTGNYNDYQTVDANRKRSLSVTNNVGGTDLTTKDRAVFNSIVDKANKSPLLAAADRTIVLKNTIDQVNKDPANGALQLNLSYAYIQALDTYQSAVREGELNLVGSIDSKIGDLQNSIQQIQNGQVVRPEIAKKIAAAAATLVDTIKQGATAKDKQFQAQAHTNGDAVGKAWDDYRGSFTSSFDDPNKGTGNTDNDPLGLGF